MTTPVGSDRELDVENATRGVWLVKVPKYMSSEWEKAKSKEEIGRLKITKYVILSVCWLFISCDDFYWYDRGPLGKPDIRFEVSDAVIEKAARDKPDTKIPKEHRFTVSDISHQHMAVFSHEKG